MPHVVVLYTANLEAETDMTALCRALADALQAVHDENGRRVFPTGGVRVFAYPAAHHAVADGSCDFGFCWLNLRMGRGRSAGVQHAAGVALADAAKRHFAPLLERQRVGLTLQVDEGHEVFDAKLGNLHALFQTKD
jgi:5-carboxymethyl-2-hydroxymuconate isomerase